MTEIGSRLKATITKLGAARTRLILERPFIGALVMHLPLRAADPAWCETTATDARAFYFNPEYIAALTLAQTQFVLAHEAMHCALGHFARRSHRTRRRWDVACDHAANLLLVEEGLKPPPGSLANPDFRGLSAEEIYPLIAPDTPERTLDRHLFDDRAAEDRPGSRSAGDAGPPSSNAMKEEIAWRSGDDAERDSDSWDDAGNERRSAGGLPLEPGPVGCEELVRRWQSRMVSAAQQARLAGRLNDSWLRRVDRLIEPRLPWRVLLARYLMSAARDDYSFQRPSRREGEALLPRLAGDNLDLYVALDTSGSIGHEELAQFATELDALKGQVRARVVVQGCDERLDPQGPWTFQPWEPLSLPQVMGGGGGTSFVPVFEWIAARRLQPDLLLYFTDAMGKFPPDAPAYPVIWLVKGGGKVPWGERIQLN
ncbi:MAG TPA: VWA-like domain-containing protein [Burkholderiales bacterium]|nr:VWA-like domain-containing protein [Burkholderiales bacterium]